MIRYFYQFENPHGLLMPITPNGVGQLDGKMMQLDHFTIRTSNLPATKAFFIELFDLEERPRPVAIQRIPGHWLYADDKPLVHLIGSHAGGQSPEWASDAIDHVGLRLEGYQAFRAKLDKHGVRYSAMDLPELNERRLFLRAPGGPLLEAVFSESVATEVANKVH